jgi:hypothetical protein
MEAGTLTTTQPQTVKNVYCDHPIIKEALKELLQEGRQTEWEETCAKQYGSKSWVGED